MKKRFLTATFLILFAIFYIAVGVLPQEFKNSDWLALIFQITNTVILCWALNEVINLQRHKNWHWTIKILIFAFGILLLWFPILKTIRYEPYYNQLRTPNPSRLEFLQLWMIMVAYVSFFVALMLITFFTKKFKSIDALFIFVMTVFLVLAFKTMNYITLQYDDFGWPTVIFVLLITVSNDTFAYLGGMLFGRHKLAPKVSPKKTWEGALCGLMMGIIVTLGYTALLTELGGRNLQPLKSIFSMNTEAYRYAIYFIIILFLSIISQIGDLLFSGIKRFYHVKDFNNILPGHGGLLDRIDSITLVLFCLGLFIFIQNVT